MVSKDGWITGHFVVHFGIITLLYYNRLSIPSQSARNTAGISEGSALSS